MAQDLYFSSSAASTTLSSGISNSATSMTVGSITGLPVSYPYLLILDPDTASEEVVLVTAGGGTTLTVTRGYDSTTGLSHSAGAVVQHGVSAKAFNDLYILKAAAATLAGTEVLTNKTIDGDSNTVQDLPYSALKQAAGTAWTPTVTQVGTVTLGTNDSRYFRLGNLVYAYVYVVPSSSGTDANAITVSLPVAARSTQSLNGAGRLFAEGASLWSGYDVSPGANTSQVKMRSGLTTYAGSSAGNRLNVDITKLYGWIVYEAA